MTNNPPKINDLQLVPGGLTDVVGLYATGSTLKLAAQAVKPSISPEPPLGVCSCIREHQPWGLVTKSAEKVPTTWLTMVSLIALLLILGAALLTIVRTYCTIFVIKRVD